MKNLIAREIGCVFAITLGVFMAPFQVAQAQGIVDSMAMYQENCAVCHGENLEGAPLGRPLRGDLLHGSSVTEIEASISNGYEQTGMPAWQRTLNDAQIRNLALYIAEARTNVEYQTFNFDTPLTIPDTIISSELHSFRIDTIATDLDAQPYSIAPLPDGRILLTEKKRGVSIIGRDGRQSELIQGTPQAYDDSFIVSMEQERGWGWIFDIALHPDYEQNGWIYLSYGDRCEGCNALSRAAASPVSMNKLIRGKIEDGAWVNQQTIWEADIEHYGNQTDLGAGGRVTFDDSGHAGMKKLLEIPDGLDIVALAPIGYPADGNQAFQDTARRKPVEATFSRERYKEG